MLIVGLLIGMALGSLITISLLGTVVFFLYLNHQDYKDKNS